MQDKFLSAEATVETIRAMRKLGFPPTPEFIGSLVQVISDMHPDMEKEPDGTYQFEIFEVPFIFSFVLSDADFQTSDVGADRRKAVFSLLDHSTDLPTIVDSGRVAVRIASSTEINSTGIDFWNDLVQDVQDGEFVPHDLVTKLRNYVLDLDAQIGYRLGVNRTLDFRSGAVAAPRLANKTVMVINFPLLNVDGEPVAIVGEAIGRTMTLDDNGRADPVQFEQMQQRTMKRAFGGQHVSVSDGKRDQIANADLLNYTRQFKATDYPLFFDDLVRFEVLGEKVERCKRSLPR